MTASHLRQGEAGLLRGGVAIRTNTIGGDLQCEENVPAPTGFGNRVGGNKEDQCRNP